jgi:hypothetical protein
MEHKFTGTWSPFEDDEEIVTINAIETVKKAYEEQVETVKRATYVQNLIFQDYLRKIRSHKSRYDYIGFIKEAQGQVEKKKKSERKDLAMLESFIQEDFLSNSKEFKITKIICCGFENYGWTIEMEGLGQTIEIRIPVMANITAENLVYADYGQFSFAIRTSSFSTSVLKSSYKIQDIADYIREYFKLEKISD